MKCIEAQQLVKPYLKKQLSDRELERFLDHVDGCPDCYDELEIYFIIYEALEDIEDTQKTEKDNFDEELKQNIRNSRRYLHVRKAYRLFRLAAIILAELLLLFTVITGIEMLGEEGSEGTTIYRVIYGRSPLHRDPGIRGAPPDETEDRDVRESIAENETEVSASGEYNTGLPGCEFQRVTEEYIEQMPSGWMQETET